MNAAINTINTTASAAAHMATLGDVAALLLLCLLGLYVLLASACRVYKLNPGQHKASWRIMYVVYATFGALLVGYTLHHQPDAELLAVLAMGALGAALNLAITHQQWQANQNGPAITLRNPAASRTAPPLFADAGFDHHHAAQANAAAESKWHGYKKGGTP